MLHMSCLARHFDPEPPLYGIKAPDINEARGIPGSIESIASAYVDEVLACTHRPVSSWGAIPGGVNCL